MILDYSEHAAERRVLMDIQHREVADAIRWPETSYPADDRRVPGGTCRQRGRLVVILDREGGIITLLWHGALGRTPDGTPLAPEVVAAHIERVRRTAPHHRLYRRRVPAR